ncbi:MAG TPA: alkaline phosphatase family protein [Acidimicrobiia bacterium]|nr:alkaline phosphatase family protein [Acidimicrobiia bacterium]
MAAPIALAPAGSPCGFRAGSPVRYAHVVWIWMENRTYGDVVGNAAAPYETSLAARCGTDRDYHQVGSPSLPNYLGATSGQTYGIADDADPAAHPITADNLFRQVRTAGGTERSYVENMPTNCAGAPQGTYAVKHNPATYYDGGGDHAACLADDVPLGSTTTGPLTADLDRGRLPSFALVVPDLCDDGHDCPAATGDRWLAGWLPHILYSSAYRSGNTAVFVVWDEPTPMPNIVISPTTPPGLVSSVAVNHYALLRTTEELLGLPLLGEAVTSPTLRPLFRL